MKATELRIGNLIYDTVGIVIEIDALSYEILSAKNSGTCRYETTRGIALTEEWILKLGFYQNSGVAEREYLIKGGYYMAVNHYENGFLFIDTNAWKYGRMIKYVHQLQNLYYALTGEELTIKENATEA